MSLPRRKVSLLVALLGLYCLHIKIATSQSFKYADVLDLSFRFYEAQMSGNVPTWSRASQAAGGWRNKSHFNDGMNSNGIGVDLSGGWYDDTAHLKSNLPMGMSASVIAFGALTYESAYRAAGQWDIAVRNLDWVASYFIKCHYKVNASNAAGNAFVGQIGEWVTENQLYWGRPEQQTQGGAYQTAGWRPVQTITTAGLKGADVVAQAVATLTGGSLMLNRTGAYKDPVKAATYLSRAKTLFAFARTLSKEWTPSNGTSVYRTFNYKDDMAWAAAWLCKADVDIGITQANSAACATALTFWDAVKGVEEWTFSYANVTAPTAMLLRDIGAGNSTYITSYETVISNLLNKWVLSPYCSANNTYVCATRNLTLWWDIPVQGNSFPAFMSLLALAATRNESSMGAGMSTATRASRICWARRQIDYMLGANPFKNSFVVGYAFNGSYTYTVRPTHRSSSCDPNYAVTCDWNTLALTSPNPSVLKGALVSGPNRAGQYGDVRKDSYRNSVGVTHNAGFVGALAGLLAMEGLLQKAGCSWDTFCGQTCSPFPPPPPPPPSPSPPPPAAVCPYGDNQCAQCNNYASSDTCRQCYLKLKPTAEWFCTNCGAVNSNGPVQAVCQTECLMVQWGTAVWPSGVKMHACYQCTTNSLVGNSVAKARDCINCSKTYDPWSCQQCVEKTNALADVDTARKSCMSCLASRPTAWDCTNCIDMTRNLADASVAREWCTKCVVGNILTPWECGDCAKNVNPADRVNCYNTKAAGRTAAGRRMALRA